MRLIIISAVMDMKFNHEQAMRDAEEVFTQTVIYPDVEMSVEAYDYEWVKEPCYEIVGE